MSFFCLAIYVLLFLPNSIHDNHPTEIVGNVGVQIPKFGFGRKPYQLPPMYIKPLCFDTDSNHLPVDSQARLNGFFVLPNVAFWEFPFYSHELLLGLVKLLL